MNALLANSNFYSGIREVLGKLRQHNSIQLHSKVTLKEWSVGRSARPTIERCAGQLIQSSSFSISFRYASTHIQGKTLLTINICYFYLQISINLHHSRFMASVVNDQSDSLLLLTMHRFMFLLQTNSSHYFFYYFERLLFLSPPTPPPLPPPLFLWFILINAFANSYFIQAFTKKNVG